MHFLILGYGRFGQLALNRLKQTFPSAHFTIVDRQSDRLARIPMTSVRTLRMDGLVGLKSEFSDMGPDDWIIPAIPVHVAYEWMVQCFKETHHIEVLDVPGEILEQVPHPIRGENKAVYSSIADFICPEDCQEPESICSCTGKPRPIVLNDALANLKHRLFQPIVMYSRQLAPGVGGYRISDLNSALTAIIENSGPYLLATACKCHGVMHVFRLIPIRGRI